MGWFWVGVREWGGRGRKRGMGGGGLGCLGMGGRSEWKEEENERIHMKGDLDKYERHDDRYEIDGMSDFVD